VHFVRIPEMGTKPGKPACSALLVILWPAVLCGCMLTVAAVTAYIAHIDVRRLIGYFNCTLATLFCVLVVVFIETAKLAFQRAD